MKFIFGFHKFSKQIIFLGLLAGMPSKTLKFSFRVHGNEMKYNNDVVSLIFNMRESYRIIIMESMKKMCELSITSLIFVNL